MITIQKMAIRYSMIFIFLIMSIQPALLLLNYLNYMLQAKVSEPIQFGILYFYDKILTIIFGLFLSLMLRRTKSILAMYIGVTVFSLAIFEAFSATRPKYLGYIMFLLIFSYSKYISLFSSLPLKAIGSIHIMIYAYHLIRIAIFQRNDPKFPLFYSIALFTDFVLLDFPYVSIHNTFMKLISSYTNLISDFKLIINLIPNPVIIFNQSTFQVAFFNKSAGDLFINPTTMSNMILSSTILTHKTISKYGYKSRFYNLFACALKSNTFSDDCIIISMNDITEVTETEKAIATENAKWLFINTANHQIRTPLSGIESSLYLLKSTLNESNNKEEMLKQLHASLYSVGGLRHLVDDTVLFIEDKDDKIVLSSHPFTMADICSEIANLLEFEIYSKDILFKVEEASYPYYLIGDKKRLMHIIYTLLSNSFKYTTKGEVCFKHTIIPLEEKVCLQIQVLDTGVGMSKEEIESLFHLFGNADKNKVEAKVSTGLSLYVVKKLCELMDGKIECISKKNIGTTFNVTVFLKENVKMITNSPKRRLLSSADSSNSLFVSPKVLIVDDNMANLYVINSMLTKLNVDCDQAHNGLEAVEKYSISHHSLILMDINMPVMNGYEASTKIREHSKSAKKSVTIIAVSAQDEPVQEFILKSYGIDLWIVKPIKMNELQDILLRRKIIYHNS